MHFHGPIVRPQTDAYSVFVEVTVGCTHNSCKFCNFYKGFPFRVAPMEQIEEDLQEARRRWPKAKHVWASGGNPFALSTTKLLAIAKLFKKYMPQAEINTYARVDDLKRKSVADIKALRAAGYNSIVLGLESGDDEVLKNMNKGYNSQEILDGCRKLEEGGIDYRIIYLGGLAGRGKGVESARRTAEVFNQIHPFYMYLTTVSVLRDTPLYDEVLTGEFEEETEKERLQEFHELLKDMKNPITVFSETSTVTVPFIANMPKDKQRILPMLENVIEKITPADERRILEARRMQTAV